jgi:hypothetical protein
VDYDLLLQLSAHGNAVFSEREPRP